VKKYVKTAIAVAGAVAALALLSGCTEVNQQDPVEKTFKLKDGSEVTCLVVYDETGEIIEEMTCPPVEAAGGQPTAK
jgi:hypothetical protein